MNPKIISWLPQTIDLSSYKGNWTKYGEVVYKKFKEDFIESWPFFNGEPVALLRLPEINGKHQSYWHFVTSDQNQGAHFK